jgi:uncharacterized membrane protein
MKAQRFDARTVALVAIMAAVTCVFTLVRFPILAGRGYIHLGDIAANLAAIAFGPWMGLVIAGGGTALADILGGYAFFAPYTFVIHGLQGFVVGYIAYLGQRRLSALLIGAIVGEAVMVVGYFAVEVWLYGGVAPAVAELPWNVVQGVFGVLGVPLFIMVARSYPPLLHYGGRRAGGDRDH